MVDEATQNRAILEAPTLGTLLAIRDTLDRIERVFQVYALGSLFLIGATLILVLRRVAIS